jgi:hypothetical protein
MMSVGRLAVGLLGALSLATVAAGEASGQGLTTSIADSVRVATPGTPVSLLFTIQSSRGTASEAQVSVPRSWRILTGGGALPAGSHRIAYMVGVFVPSTAGAGKYPVTLSARDAESTAVSTGWIVVPAVRSISLTVLESPQFLVAGNDGIAKFLLVNRGNVETMVKLRLRSTQSKNADTVTVHLAAAESRQISVVIPAPKTTTSAIQSVTSVTAVAPGHTDVTAAASVRVSIAPREAYARAPVQFIESRIRLIGASSPRGGNGAEIFGSGSLREGSNAKVEYVARRIYGQGSMFGDRSEYRLSVSSPRFSVTAGDQVNTLSSLSESGRFGRGIATSVASNGWTVGGFSSREATTASSRDSRALFLNRDFGNGIFLGVNYFNRQPGGSVLTAHTSIRSLGVGTIDGEIGHAINSKAAEAYMVSAAGNFDRFQYSVYRQKSDAAYAGSTGGTETFNASFDARPVNGIRVRAAANDYRAHRTASVPRIGETHHWNGLVSVALRNFLTLDGMRNGREDKSFSGGPKRTETLGSARIAVRSKSHGFTASAAIGSADTGAGRATRLARYTAQASIRRGKGSNFSLNVESLRGGTLFLPGETSELRAGIGGNFATRLGVFSMTGYLTEHTLGRRVRDTNIEAVWEKDLPQGSKVSVRARVHRNPFFDSSDDNAVRAEYTIPFGMPVGPSRIRGRIAGRVIDVDTRAAISGAVIQLGTQVSITDARGRFAFAVDAERPVLLNFGGSAATAGLIPLENLPLTIVPRIGRTQTFEVAVTKAGQIEGTVSLFVPAPGFRPDDERPSVKDENATVHVRVEAWQDSEVHRVHTGPFGRFTFTDLRPGRWVIRIADAELPQLSTVEGDSVVVNVARGQTQTAVVNIVPRRRKVRLVQIGK